MTNQSDRYTTSAQLIANMAEVSIREGKLLAAMAPMTDSDARIRLSHEPVDELIRALGLLLGPSGLREVVDTVVPAPSFQDILDSVRTE